MTNHARARPRMIEPFGALPVRLLRDLALGDIDFDDLGILAFLTMKHNPHTDECWIGTTRALAMELCWPHTDKHLTKKLRRLAERGYVSSTAKRGSSKPYVLRLLRASSAREAPEKAVLGATHQRPELLDRPEDADEARRNGVAEKSSGASPQSQRSETESEEIRGQKSEAEDFDFIFNDS